MYYFFNKKMKLWEKLEDAGFFVKKGVGMWAQHLNPPPTNPPHPLPDRISTPRVYLMQPSMSCLGGGGGTGWSGNFNPLHPPHVGNFSKIWTKRLAPGSESLSNAKSCWPHGQKVWTRLKNCWSLSRECLRTKATRFWMWGAWIWVFRHLQNTQD